jgi:hypothetical protein
MRSQELKNPNLKMIQNRCIRMTGKYPRGTNIPFIHADFSILKLDE